MKKRNKCFLWNELKKSQIGDFGRVKSLPPLSICDFLISDQDPPSARNHVISSWNHRLFAWVYAFFRTFGPQKPNGVTGSSKLQQFCAARRTAVTAVTALVTLAARNGSSGRNGRDPHLANSPLAPEKQNLNAGASIARIVPGDPAATASKRAFGIPDEVRFSAVTVGTP
jgi:hypothetical protein